MLISIGRFLRWLTIVIIITLVLLEITLQVSALFLEKRSVGQDTWFNQHSIRVVTMGDSNTYGLYLQEEQSYPALLEKKWQSKYPKVPLEVINLGFPGTNSSRVLKSLPQVIDTFSPDIITVMIGVNDFWMAPVNVEGVQSPLSKKEAWLRDHSRVYKLVYMLHRELYQSDLLTIDDDDYRQLTYDPNAEAEFRAVVKGEKPAIESKPNAIRYGDQDFSIGYVVGSSKKQKPGEAMRKNLLAMVEVAKQSQVQLVFLTYAYYESPQRVANRNMKRTGNEMGVPVINIARRFKQQCGNSTEVCQDLFFPDFHPTAKGYEMVADDLIEGLGEIIFCCD